MERALDSVVAKAALMPARETMLTRSRGLNLSREPGAWSPGYAESKAKKSLTTNAPGLLLVGPQMDFSRNSMLPLGSPSADLPTPLSLLIVTPTPLSSHPPGLQGSPP